jgi:hypothetical protein
MLYAEPSNTNWLGNQVELPSFTAAKLQSQVAVGHSKTMLFKIALSVLVVIVALLLIAAIKPNSFRVQRSITIHASQEEVFSLINDLHSWDAWSDDGGGGGTVQKTYTGPASGVGAVAEWNGSGRAGAAKMLITESVVPSKVSVQVDWIIDTQATWSIQASNLYAMKLIGIFVNIESQFGQHMESGLNNLKRATEKKESDRSVDKMPGSSPVP